MKGYITIFNSERKCEWLVGVEVDGFSMKKRYIVNEALAMLYFLITMDKNIDSPVAVITIYTIKLFI